MITKDYNKIVETDFYLEIFYFIEERFFNNGKWRKPDSFEFDMQVSLNEVIEKFEGLGYSANDIEYCFNTVKDFIVN